MKLYTDFGGLGPIVELDPAQPSSFKKLYGGEVYPMAKGDKDPSGKDLKQPGAKADLGKAPIFRGLLDYFPRACREVSLVSETGARKYSWKGWESVPDGIQRYSDALSRHLVSEAIEGPIDSDTGMLHKAQIAWNALAVLELYLREQEKNPV